MIYINVFSSLQEWAPQWKCLLILAGVFGCLAAGPGRSYAQASCEQALDRANGYYYNARFEEAIGLLKQCLDQGAFSQEEQRQAYTLLSMACFANRQEADARQAIQILLSLNPDYNPDPVSVQPSYRALVEDVRSERSPGLQAAPPAPAAPLSLTTTTTGAPQSRRGLSKWIYFGGGAVLTSVAILLLSSGDGSNPPPGPPPPPGR